MLPLPRLNCYICNSPFGGEGGRCSNVLACGIRCKKRAEEQKLFDNNRKKRETAEEKKRETAEKKRKKAEDIKERKEEKRKRAEEKEQKVSQCNTNYCSECLCIICIIL